jgi:hypothetical protein
MRLPMAFALSFISCCVVYHYGGFALWVASCAIAIHHARLVFFGLIAAIFAFVAALASLLQNE